VRQEHDTEREDIRTKNVDDINMLRLTLESVIDDLEKQFDEAHAQVPFFADEGERDMICRFESYVAVSMKNSSHLQAPTNKISIFGKQIIRFNHTHTTVE
jgi:hypothetical protein